LKIDN